MEISENPKLIYAERNFSPDEYFKNVVGIFSPLGEPPQIILEFKKEAAQYIITQPIHDSQQLIRETDESVTFSLKVHPTVEFFQMILGWGSEVKIVEPISLQNKIKDSLLANLQQYQKA